MVAGVTRARAVALIHAQALAMALLGTACQPSAPSVALPGFAAGLPGHTVAVLWSEQAELPPIEWPPAVEAWLGVARGESGSRLQAWTGDATAVGWHALADNSLFAAACACGLRGGRMLFVDLQQLVDLVVRAAASDSTGSAQGDAMRGMVVQQLLAALRLRSAQWLLASERSAGERRQVQAVLAATDTGEGLFGLLAPASAETVPEQLPSAGADLICSGHFLPQVAVRLVRDLMTGDGNDGPLQMAREMLRGPRLEAGVALIKALNGHMQMCASREFGYVWVGVGDAKALGDALDVLAQPDADGWRVGGWKVKQVVAGVQATFGRLPPAAQPVRRVTRGLSFTFPKLGIEGMLQPDEVANRLRLDLDMPLRIGR